MEQDLTAVLDDSEFRRARSKSPSGTRRPAYERPANSANAQSQNQNPTLLDVAADSDVAAAMRVDIDIDGDARSDNNNGNNNQHRMTSNFKRVYVGNLAYEVGWQDLKDYMRKAGDVVFADVLTMPGGRSKGCGVVEYGTADEAQRAIEELNDTPLMGRNVFIREDREPDLKFGDRRSGPGGGGSSGGGSRGGPNPCGVFVSNLPYIVAWQDLKDLFRQAGSVTRADVQEGPDRRSKGSGIVVFETSADAQNAISMFNGYEWHGRKIEVREDLGSRGGDGGADRGDRGDRGDREYSRSRGGGSGGDNRACFKCGKSGHIARDCRDGGGGPYRDYPPRRDYYDQGRGGYGGGYDRGYGPPRGGPYGYNQRGYDDYYGGRGGYGGGGGGYSGGPPGGYRDYPPSRGGYNDFPPRGPPMPGGPGGMNPYNDYGPPNHGPKDFSGRDYQSGQGSHVQGSNIYGNF